MKTPSHRSPWVPRKRAGTDLATTLIALLSLLVSCGQLCAQGSVDRVRMVKGSEAGEVQNMSPVEVTLSKGSTGSRRIPVNQITSILYKGEPSQLTQARVNATGGGYRNALETLARINADEVTRDFVKQDIEFYRALCTARLALTGNAEIVDAGRLLTEFIRGNPRSYHYLEAVEVLGDLLVATERYAAAERQYAELAKAPWPDYKIRSAVLVGRALQAQNKHAEALQKFDEALGIASSEDKGERLAATLGKAVSLSETGKVDEGVALIERVIQDADPENKQLHARAYNALGNCYKKAGRTKDALLAFLHVDVLYSTVGDAHAEALSHLVPLWESMGQEARARQARQLLSERYASSRWAQ